MGSARSKATVAVAPKNKNITSETIVRAFDDDDVVDGTEHLTDPTIDLLDVLTRTSEHLQTRRLKMTFFFTTTRCLSKQ